jgi:hypothetical protein
LRLHRWFEPPLHAHRTTGVPFAVPLPDASRHRPETSLVTVPFAFTVHFWFVPPLQSHRTTRVPLAVPLSYASRHLLT